MGCCPELEALEKAVSAVEEGKDPRAAAEGLLEEQTLISFVSEQGDFFGDDEKTRKFIKGLGLPKDGFFRACKEKLKDPERRGDITDTDEFCGKLKSVGVNLGLANPG